MTAGAAHDTTGNLSFASGLLSVLIDTTRPTVVLNPISGNPVRISPFDVGINFSEDVQGFVANKIKIVNGTVSSLVAGNSTSIYTLKVQPASVGTVSISIPDSAVTDTAGNYNVAAVPA